MQSKFLSDQRLVVPLVLFVVTSVYLYEAFQIRPQNDEGLFGPSFLPVVISVVMYIGLAFVVFAILRKPLGEDDKPTPLNLWPAFKVVVATGAYIAVFEPLGYALATLLYVFSLLYLFRMDSSLVMRVVYSVIITAVFYVLFHVFFDVRLPTLTEWL